MTDILEVVAVASAGDPGCCGQHNSDGRCCMTRVAREIFQAMANAGGPSLEQCQALVSGEARIVPAGVTVPNRDELADAYEIISEVEQAVQSLPYRDAHPVIARLNELRDMIGESLPGGYFGACPICGEIRGHDEMVAGDDFDICKECADGYADHEEELEEALTEAIAAAEAADG